MELIKSISRRSKLSEVMYVILNIAYAGFILGLTLGADLPYLAFLVVVLSKWRVFAVRPRFWFANLQANTVDLLVSVSVVTLLLLNTGSISIQVGLAVAFAIWLVFIKPRSQRRWVIAQAGISQFISLMALFSVAYALPSSLVTALGWLVGYITARHILTNYTHETERTFLSLIWGLIIAELSWLSYHWTIAYPLGDDFKVPQISLVTALIGFLVIRVYTGLYNAEGDAKLKGLGMPVAFVVIAILLLMVRFNGFNLAQL